MRWISVKDELPKEKGMYLVLMEGISLGWINSFYRPEFGFYSVDHGCSQPYFIRPYVSHWMKIDPPDGWPPAWDLQPDMDNFERLLLDTVFIIKPQGDK